MSTITDPTLPPGTSLVPAPSAPASPVLRAPVIVNGAVHIPADIVDLESFRRWAHSADFPEQGRIDYLNGVIWVDLTLEQLYSHNQVKTEIAAVLRFLVRATQQGLLMGDRMRLTMPAVDLSTEPDTSFVSYDRLTRGQVREIPGKRGGVMELEGTPDMVLEIVSDSSVEKDNVRLPQLYQLAGLPELWLVDVRGPEVRFEILQWTAEGYQPRQESDRWWRSAVFGRSFRLTQQIDPRGQPCFELEVRD